MHYKLFGKSGLRVSELCLGAMTFGLEWGTGADKSESKRLFDAFAQAGGNFIDTANRYTEGSSERFLADFVATQRDYFVLATKYTLYDRPDDPNASGNHRKNLMRSVEGSLRRLNTDYIDLLWVHAWDFTTSPEEVMRGLDDLVRAGKVHYIGISDTPAWIVAQANTLAELRGWTAFVGLQIEYSLIQRSPERDLLPMARHFGLSITPWSPLGAGILTGKYNEGMIAGGRLSEKSVKFNERNLQIARQVSTLAQEMGVSPAQVALQWLRQQGPDIIPIIGARNLAQLEDALGCLSVSLNEAQLQDLETISQIDLGFPHDFLRSEGVRRVSFGNFYDKIEHRLKG
ncbi:MAG: aldo/keto reductase [Microscillaceae bacterium]|nr:aldo/keto reductase [Microscillaceae bacterium]